jgi:hypothetical protein
MKYGFVKVAAATPVTAVADCYRNAQSIIELTAELTRLNAELILFPELCLTSCSCGDLFTQPHFIQACDKAIASIADATAESDAIIVLGAPVEHRNALYNCTIVMHKGEIVKRGKPQDIFSIGSGVEAFGLTLPRAVYIANELIKNGLPIKNGILDEEELTGELCKLFQKA